MTSMSTATPHYALNNLAVEFQNKSQYAVRRRVLRPTPTGRPALPG
jgi:hypothetical protein